MLYKMKYKPLHLLDFQEVNVVLSFGVLPRDVHLSSVPKKWKRNRLGISWCGNRMFSAMSRQRMGPTSAPSAFMCVAMLKLVAWQPVLWLKFGMAMIAGRKQDAAFSTQFASHWLKRWWEWERKKAWEWRHPFWNCVHPSSPFFNHFSQS